MVVSTNACHYARFLLFTFMYLCPLAILAQNSVAFRARYPAEPVSPSLSLFSIALVRYTGFAVSAVWCRSVSIKTMLDEQFGCALGPPLRRPVWCETSVPPNAPALR